MFQSKKNSPCLSIGDGFPADGCALFFRTQRLRLLDSFVVHPDVDGEPSNQVVSFVLCLGKQEGGRAGS